MKKIIFLFALLISFILQSFNVEFGIGFNRRGPYFGTGFGFGAPYSYYPPYYYTPYYYRARPIYYNFYDLDEDYDYYDDDYVIYE